MYTAYFCVFAENIENIYNDADGGDRKIDMIKKIKNSYNLTLRAAKSLVEWHIAYRVKNYALTWTGKSSLSEKSYDRNKIMENIEEVTYGELTFHTSDWYTLSDEPNLDAIFSSTLKKKDSLYTIIVNTDTDGRKYYEAETVAEVDRVKDILVDLGMKVSVYKKVS